MVLAFMQGIKGSRRWGHKNTLANNGARSRSHSASAALQQTQENDVVINIGNPSQGLRTLDEHDHHHSEPRWVAGHSPQLQLDLSHDSETFFNDFSKDYLGKNAQGNGSRSVLTVELTAPPVPEKSPVLGSKLSVDSGDSSLVDSGESSTNLNTPMQTYHPNAHLSGKSILPQPSSERVRPTPTPLEIPELPSSASAPESHHHQPFSAPVSHSGHHSPASDADNASAISGFTVAREAFAYSFLFPASGDTEGSRNSMRQSQHHRSGMARQDSATLPKEQFFWWKDTSVPGTASSSIKSPFFIPPVPPLPSSAASSPGTSLLNIPMGDGMKNAKRLSDGGPSRRSRPLSNPKLLVPDHQFQPYRISRIVEAPSPVPSTPDTPERSRQRDKRAKERKPSVSPSLGKRKSPSSSVLSSKESRSSTTLSAHSVSAVTPQATSSSSVNATPVTPTPGTAGSPSSSKDRRDYSFLETPLNIQHSLTDSEWVMLNGATRKSASQGTATGNGSPGGSQLTSADSTPPTSAALPSASPSAWKSKPGQRARSKSRTRRRSSVASLKDTASIKKKPATLQLLAEKRTLAESSKRLSKRDSSTVALLPIGNRRSAYQQQQQQPQSRQQSESASSSARTSLNSDRIKEERRPSLQLVTPPLTASVPGQMSFPVSTEQNSSSGTSAGTSASTSATSSATSPDLLDILVQGSQVIGPNGQPHIPRSRKRSATTPGGASNGDKERGRPIGASAFPMTGFRSQDGQQTFPETPRTFSPSSQWSLSPGSTPPRVAIWSPTAAGGGRGGRSPLHTVARTDMPLMQKLSTIMSSDEPERSIVGVNATMGKRKDRLSGETTTESSGVSLTSTTQNLTTTEPSSASSPHPSPSNSPPISPLEPPPLLPQSSGSPSPKSGETVAARTESAPFVASNSLPSTAANPSESTSLRNKKVLSRPPLPVGPRGPTRLSSITHAPPGMRSVSSSSNIAGIASAVSAQTQRQGSMHLKSQSSSSSLNMSIRTTMSRRPTLVASQPPEFRTEPVRWRGYTLDAAKWTFTSEQLQSLVSRAIRQSGEASSIRLLPPSVIDDELPAEIKRLETSLADLKMKYKVQARKRRMLLNSLSSNSNGMSEKGSQDMGIVARLVEDLNETCMNCDLLSEELYRQADQLAQISRLRDVHSASALAMALRKINGSLVQRSTEVVALREEVQALKAERDDAWAKAEELAHDLDDLNDHIQATTPVPSTSACPSSMRSPGCGTPKSPHSRRSSQVSVARMNSARVSKAGLRISTMSGQSKRTSRGSARGSTVLSARSSSADDIPPVPSIPERMPLAVSTDVFGQQSMALSPDAPPSSGIRAMDQAHRELLEELGFSSRSARPHSAGPYCFSPRSPLYPGDPFPNQTPTGFRPGHASRMSLPDNRRPKREATTIHDKETILALLSLPPLM